MAVSEHASIVLDTPNLQSLYTDAFVLFRLNVPRPIHSNRSYASSEQADEFLSYQIANADDASQIGKYVVFRRLRCLLSYLNAKENYF